MAKVGESGDGGSEKLGTEQEQRARSPFRRLEERRRAAGEEFEQTGQLSVPSQESAAVGFPEVTLEDSDAGISLPPGPRRPATIQTAQWVYRPTEFMEGCRAAFGPVFTARLGPLRNAIFLSDPAYVKSVLTGDPDLLSTGDINGIFRPIIGPHSILILDGARHLEQRRLLLPPFHGESLRRYEEVMREVTESEIESWPTGRRIPILPRMHAISIEILLRAVLGIRDDQRRERLRDLLPRFLELSQSSSVFMPFLRTNLGRRSWGRLMSAIEDLDAELYDEIRLRRAAANGHGASDDVLSLLVASSHQDGSPLSDEELRDELITLLVAGYETTSGALALGIEEIARHPEVMEGLQGNREVDPDHYAEATVREALRIKPVLPIVGRKLRRPARLGPYALPRGAVLIPCAYLLHRETAMYPDPEEFRPERFLGPAPGSYSWIPFGGGIRRCVGASFALLQMQTVLKLMFGKLDVQPGGRPEPVRRRSVSVAPARGGQVIVTPRRTA